MMEKSNSGDFASAHEFLARLEKSRHDADLGLGQLLEAYRPYLLRIANEEIDADLRGKAGGSDLVQQTFLEVHKDFASFRGTTEGELIAWLRMILLNNVGNFRRQFRANGKRDREREVPIDAFDSAATSAAVVLPTGEPSPSNQALAREETEAIEQALARLPEDYRQAIVLRHQQHRSFAEIGAALGRSTEAARKLWARAIEALQAELSPSS